MWTLYEPGVQYVRDAQNGSEWWTLWRRVAGGLDTAAQARLGETLLTGLRPLTGKAAKDKQPGVEDMARLAAVLGVMPRGSSLVSMAVSRTALS